MKKTIASHRTYSIAGFLACLGSIVVSCQVNNGLFETVSQKARFAPAPIISISSTMPWYRTVDPVTITLSAPLSGVKLRYSINDTSIDKGYSGGFSLFEGYAGATSLTIRAYAFHPDYNDSATVEASYQIVPSGNIFNIAGTGNSGFSGDGGFAVSSQINKCEALALSPALPGNALVYIADTKNDRIRLINGSTKLITTIVGPGGLVTSPALANPTAICVNAAETVMYFADTDPSAPTDHRIIRVTGLGSATPVLTVIAGVAHGYTADATHAEITFAGDGGPASSASLSQVGGMCLNAAETTLYFCDTGNNRIRSITDLGTSPVISTIAGTNHSYTAGPSPVEITFAGDGGNPILASLCRPTKLCLDASGTNLYFSDTDNDRIRVITALGTTPVISTIAGSTRGFSGDGGAAGSASLDRPTGLTLGPGGASLYFADTGNNRVRHIAGLTASSVISTVAGSSSASLFYGNNVAAANPSIAFNFPQDVLVDASGNIYIADTGNNCVRQIFSY